MHRLPVGVDLPVLGKLPVERAAQAFEHRRGGLLPAWRGDKGLGDRKPRGLQHLCALAVADVDGNSLEVQRPLVGAAHQSHRQISPHVLAVLARVSLLDPAPLFFPRKHSVHRVLQRRDVVGVRDVEHRQGVQLVFVVADEQAERRVDRRDLTVERHKGHARLRLLEQDSESRLHLALRLLRAHPLADVAHERQQLVAPRRQAMDRDLDLDAPSRLRDDRRPVAGGRISSAQPRREVGRQLLSFTGGREVDQRRERGQLGARVAGQVDVGVVARQKTAALGDDQTLTEVAERREQGALALELRPEVELHGPAGEDRQQRDSRQQQRPDDERADRDHELRDRERPQQPEGDDRNRKHVAEVPRVVAGVELQENDRKDDRRQGRQVVTEPLASDAEDQHAQDGRGDGDPELGSDLAGVPRGPDPDADSREHGAKPDQDRFLLQHGGRQVGLPQANPDPGDQGDRRGGVDQGHVPGPRLLPDRRRPGRSEEGIGSRDAGAGQLVGQVR